MKNRQEKEAFRSFKSCVKVLWLISVESGTEGNETKVSFLQIMPKPDHGNKEAQLERVWWSTTVNIPPAACFIAHTSHLCRKLLPVKDQLASDQNREKNSDHSLMPSAVHCPKQSALLTSWGSSCCFSSNGELLSCKNRSSWKNISQAMRNAFLTGIMWINRYSFILSCIFIIMSFSIPVWLFSASADNCANFSS